MRFEFSEATDDAQIEKLADVAEQIWLEYYPQIIALEQVKYMVENYQSASAIARQISDDGYRYFMVLGDGEIMGYLATKTDEDKLFLSKLYLKKEFRGKGYFKKMLGFAENVAGENGLGSLYLTVNKHNDNSIAVYRKKGFHITREQVTDIGNGFVMDDYVMEKTV